MFVIVGGRKSGKTEVAARWLLEDPERRALLVAKEDRRRHLLDRLAYLVPPDSIIGYWRDRILVADLIFRTHQDWRGWNRLTEIGIEDLEDVLDVVFKARIGLVTMSGTPVILPASVNEIKNVLGKTIVAEET